MSLSRNPKRAPADQTRNSAADRRPTWRQLVHRDDGSLLLTLLFTMMMFALVTVIVGTVISGQTKTRNNRDFTSAQQAADAAISDALLAANLGKINPTGTTVGPTNTLDNVTWTWTAAATADPDLYTVTATATTVPSNKSRVFKATIKKVEVSSASYNATTGGYDYTITPDSRFKFGFFTNNTTTITGAAKFDGYTGATVTAANGLAAGNGDIKLGGSTVSRIELWNYAANPSTPTHARCTPSTTCTTPATALLNQRASTDYSADLDAACAGTVLPAWSSSSGTLLQPNRCYTSLNFNTSTTQNAGTVYTKGLISVAANVKVNTVTNNETATAKNLRIYSTSTGTGYTQASGSSIAAAIYAPDASCTVTAPTDTAYATRWLGAGVCNTLTISGNPLLRYDQSLKTLSSAGGSDVWVVIDYKG